MYGRWHTKLVSLVSPLSLLSNTNLIFSFFVVSILFSWFQLKLLPYLADTREKIGGRMQLIKTYFFFFFFFVMRRSWICFSWLVPFLFYLILFEFGSLWTWLCIVKVEIVTSIHCKNIFPRISIRNFWFVWGLQ